MADLELTVLDLTGEDTTYTTPTPDRHDLVDLVADLQDLVDLAVHSGAITPDLGSTFERRTFQLLQAAAATSTDRDSRRELDVRAVEASQERALAIVRNARQQAAAEAAEIRARTLAEADAILALAHDVAAATAASVAEAGSGTASVVADPAPTTAWQTEAAPFEIVDWIAGSIAEAAERVSSSLRAPDLVLVGCDIDELSAAQARRLRRVRPELDRLTQLAIAHDAATDDATATSVRRTDDGSGVSRIVDASPTQAPSGWTVAHRRLHESEHPSVARRLLDDVLGRSGPTSLCP